jgi:hypothetical protein
VIQRRQERDLHVVLPLLSDLTEAQSRLLLLFQSMVVRHADGALPPLLDQDVADAAAATAATLETAGKGIIYQHQATSMPAQRLADELRAAVEELGAKAGAQRGRMERDAATALRQLATGAYTAAKMLPEDEPPVFLRVLGRLMSQAASESEATARDKGPDDRLIIPG